MGSGVQRVRSIVVLAMVHIRSNAMKLMSISIVCAAIASVGCAAKPSDHYDVYISDQFSPQMMEETINAFHLWETAVPVHFNIRIEHDVECQNDCIVAVPATQARIDQVSGHNYLGVTEYWTNQSLAKMYLDDQLTNDNTRLTMLAHEIGHAQSLKHTGPDSLMYPSSGPNQPSAITCIDQQQWYNLRGMQHFCGPDVKVAPNPGG